MYIPIVRTVCYEISNASLDCCCDLIARCVGHAKIKNGPFCDTNKLIERKDKYKNLPTVMFCHTLGFPYRFLDRLG